MSNYRDYENTCFICGTKGVFRTLTSDFSIGPSDLDQRPSIYARFNMSWWIQQCPNCGYVANWIDSKSRVTIDWLRSAKYTSCDGIVFKGRLASLFYKQYMICEHDHDTYGAYKALLHAAWACDDYEDTENAILCRKLAIPLLSQLIEKETEKKESMILTKADLLRRTRQFSSVKELCSHVKIKDRKIKKLMKFERLLAHEEDDKCYNVACSPSEFSRTQ